MNPYQSWQAWVQQMMQQMEQQQKVIEQLQKQVEQMKDTDPPPKTVIEKIEYHFDQLKIETLEGTLQIGLTPNGSDLSDIGDLYSNPQHQALQSDEQVLHALQNYMASDVPPWMDQYICDHNVPIREDHKERMITDIKKQLPRRLESYRSHNPQLPAETIYHQIKTEIQESMAQYFQTLEGDDKP